MSITEPIVVAALVAGAIALVGLLVNLKIAKQTRDAVADQLALAAEIKAHESQIEDLKRFAVEVELMRSSAWRLFYLIQPGREIEPFQRELEDFGEAWRKFFDSWAEAKPNVPEQLVRRLREIRHESVALVNSMLTQGQFINKAMREQLTDPQRLKRFDRSVEDLRAQLRQLLATLDVFFSYVSSARNDVLLDMLSNVRPNPTPNEDAHKGRARRLA